MDVKIFKLTFFSELCPPSTMPLSCSSGQSLQWALHTEEKRGHYGECQDCPPQDCPLGGNPEVGNPESISYQDCPPQLLCFLCIVCAWYKPWASARDMGCVFYHDIFIRTIIPDNYKFRIFDNFLVLSFRSSCLPSWPLTFSWTLKGSRI